MGEFEHETLNQRFARGSDLTFASGPGGLTIARIENRHAVATMALNGAHVLSFQPRGERPVLWTSAQSLYVEGNPSAAGFPSAGRGLVLTRPIPTSRHTGSRARHPGASWPPMLTADRRRGFDLD
jgi:hypothetical protein